MTTNIELPAEQDTPPALHPEGALIRSGVREEYKLPESRLRLPGEEERSRKRAVCSGFV